MDRPLASRTTAVLIALLAVAGCGSQGSPTHRSRAAARPTRHAALPVKRVFTAGYSVQHRAIEAVEIGDPRQLHRILVVGCVDGDEPAGIAIARRLIGRGPQTGITLWVVPNLNPDGLAAGTRVNAHLVDLNRNFPWHWRSLGPPGDPQFAGPGPLSEPETRAAVRLVKRVRPQITIWFHQHATLVDLSGGDPRIERTFARLVGLPVQELPRYPGSAASWSNALLPGTTAFVVELPAGPLPPGR